MTPKEQKEILTAIEDGRSLTRDQLLQLITFEAAHAGFGLDQLRDRALRQVPPVDNYENDARLLLGML